LPQRIIHWGLVITFGLCWWSGGRFDALHEWSGYSMIALVAWRIILGFMSKHPQARWSTMIKTLFNLAVYFQAFINGKSKRSIGHSPTGAVSVLILLGLISATAISGWMLTLEEFVGEEWLEERHYFLFNFLLAWVVLHIIVIITLSIRHRHNKITDMVTGGIAKH